MAADVDIVGRIEFRGGGIVDGMDNAVVDWCYQEFDSIFLIS